MVFAEVVSGCGQCGLSGLPCFWLTSILGSGVCLFWSGRSGGFWLCRLIEYLFLLFLYQVFSAQKGDMTVVERLLAVDPPLRAVWRAQIRSGTVS